MTKGDRNRVPEYRAIAWVLELDTDSCLSPAGGQYTVTAACQRCGAGLT